MGAMDCHPDVGAKRNGVGSARERAVPVLSGWPATGGGGTRTPPAARLPVGAGRGWCRFRRSVVVIVAFNII